MRRPTSLASLLAGLAMLAVAGCGDNEADVTSKSETRTQATPTAAAAPKPEGEACREVREPPPKQVEERKAPRAKLDRRKRYTALLKTSCGEIVIELQNRRFPKTTSSFAALAREDFYDDLIFHRIVADFVVQGGSPTGDGLGDPGYRVTEAPPEDVTYPRGTVAMAKGPQERPGTSGSQFFMVLSDRAQFDPFYAVVGRITKGLDVLDRIAAVPSDPAEDDRPTRPILIEDVTIRER